nr:SDR family oxidoreductase [Sphingomonas sp. AX6]
MADTKAIFITGGGSGIGRAVAQYFAAQGWRVGVSDVNAAGIEETRALLPASLCTAHVMDVRDREQWRKELAAFVATSGGRLDVLFNNAGIAVGGEFASTPLDDLDRLIAINLTGVVNGAHIGHPYLKATRGGGCLLSTASAAGIYGTGGASVYSATKFAVRGLTEALDGEWAKDGIRVRSIMPSFIDTPLLDAGVTGSNQNVRERVRAAGLEFTPLNEVAELAWQAVHGDAIHTVIGKTARRMKFAARWMPGALRKQGRGGL